MMMSLHGYWRSSASYRVRRATQLAKPNIVTIRHLSGVDQMKKQATGLKKSAVTIRHGNAGVFVRTNSRDWQSLSVIDELRAIAELERLWPRLKFHNRTSAQSLRCSSATASSLRVI